MDTGASAHISSDTHQLENVSTYTGCDHVTVSNGEILPISHTGSLVISPTLKLNNVLVVFGITKNLLSDSELTHDYPVQVLFTDSQF